MIFFFFFWKKYTENVIPAHAYECGEAEIKPGEYLDHWISLYLQQKKRRRTNVGDDDEKKKKKS